MEDIHPSTSQTLEQIGINDNTEQATKTAQELAKSIFEAFSKIHEPASYEEAISDPIHGRQWKEVGEEELHNLEAHHTSEFEELPQNRKQIGSKWVQSEMQPRRIHHSIQSSTSGSRFLPGPKSRFYRDVCTNRQR